MTRYVSFLVTYCQHRVNATVLSFTTGYTYLRVSLAFNSIVCTETRNEKKNIMLIPSADLPLDTSYP